MRKRGGVGNRAGGGERAKSKKEEVEERKVAAQIGFVHRSIEVSGVGDNGPDRKQVLRSGLT